jgi:hypothetical protein
VASTTSTRLRVFTDSRHLRAAPGKTRYLDEPLVDADLGGVTDAQSLFELVQGGAAEARLVSTLECSLNLITPDLAC